MNGRIAILVAVIAATAGCVPEPYDLPDAGTDASSQEGDPSADTSGAGFLPRELTCRDRQTNGESGEHRPGEACLGCHTPGGEAPAFTVAGTLYVDAGGSAPSPGATIHIEDAAGAVHELRTAANGNFWTSRALAFPVRVHASACPDAIEMVSPVQSDGGNCNLGSCHGSTFRVHLP